jgi:hypothetical protein
MKLLVSALALFAYSLGSHAAEVTLDWNPSSAPDISGYRVYYGVAPNTYTNLVCLGNTTSATIDGLAAGLTYYFAASAVNLSGVESDLSNEVSYTVPDDPISPFISITNLVQTYDGQSKRVHAATIPAGLTVLITYDGSMIAPTSAGSYTVIASTVDSVIATSVTNILTINKAVATLTVTDCIRAYTGTPVVASVVTSPAGLKTIITYNDSPFPPSHTGTYKVIATVDDPNYSGVGEGQIRIKRLLPPVGLRPVASVSSSQGPS